ncbi:uncharacterized protein WM294_012447 [Sarcoramphus papa]
MFIDSLVWTHLQGQTQCLRGNYLTLYQQAFSARPAFSSHFHAKAATPATSKLKEFLRDMCTFGWFFSLSQHVPALVQDLFISPTLLGSSGFSAGCHPVDADGVSVR